MGCVTQPRGVSPEKMTVEAINKPTGLILQTGRNYGVCNAFVRGSDSLLARCNLNNGTANGGLSALNGNNGLGNANWNILARISGKTNNYFALHYRPQTAACGYPRHPCREN